MIRSLTVLPMARSDCIARARGRRANRSHADRHARCSVVASGGRMKLYYSPGACSLSPHIALREAERAFELERVDLKTHRTASGRDYHGINPKGYVPALQLDAVGDEVLTEGPAIVQYIADLVPDKHLA